MNSGFYAACAGLVTRTQALDLAANNLANINTTGYKAQVPTFRSLLANATQNGTGNAQQRLYTRDGNFHVDGNGHLVTVEGYTVLGDQGAITIPPGKLSVSNDGTISVEGALAGPLRIVGFAPAGRWSRRGTPILRPAITGLAGQVNTNPVNPPYALNSSNNLKGTGTANSQSLLQANLAGRVVAVLPNGNLVTEAERAVSFNQQTQTVILRGLVRPGEFGSDDSVSSTSISIWNWS